ncbi:MAG: redoxin domain-containing protein [Flavobacteriales bacterium]|nr:redoxin domain-containing protein [Flavobacteriales bacterium]
MPIFSDQYPRLELALVAILVFLAGDRLHAQGLSGSIEGIQPQPARIFLFDTRGSEHRLVDSTTVDRKGIFKFREQSWPTGFYQLSLDKNDRVDIILDGRESKVVLAFAGTPLQEHIRVVASDENSRLWEYKLASRALQTELATIKLRRSQSDPFDVAALARLDSAEAKAMEKRTTTLDRLIASGPDSYFTRVVSTDRRLTAAAGKGSVAIASAIDWADASLVRSSVHPRAMLQYIQSVPFDDPLGLIAAVDSLLAWSRPETTCWSAARAFLLRVFDQFGPEEVAQHITDRYVASPEALLPAEAEIAELVNDRLRVAIGATAPPIALPDPLTGDTVMFDHLLQQNRYTALFVYSSSCDHCHDQMPGLTELWKDLGGKGFGVVGVALDDDRAEFLATREAFGLDWPGFSELRAWGSPAAKALNVKATPSFFLFDEEGRILAKPYDHEELRMLVEDLLR